jgi:hypothetical protein
VGCGLHVDVAGRVRDRLVVELRLKYCCGRHGWHLKRSTLFFVGEMGDFGGQEKGPSGGSVQDIISKYSFLISFHMIIV